MADPEAIAVFLRDTCGFSLYRAAGCLFPMLLREARSLTIEIAFDDRVMRVQSYRGGGDAEVLLVEPASVEAAVEALEALLREADELISDWSGSSSESDADESAESEMVQ